MDHHERPLTETVSLNPGGRLLFLALPVAATGLSYALAIALGAPPEVAPLGAAVVMAVAAACCGYVLLDEPAAVALERPYEHGFFYAVGIALPLFFASPAVAVGVLAAGVASWGASCGIVRIVAFSDEPDPSPGARRLAWTAWATQCTAAAALMSAPYPLAVAAISMLIAGGAIAWTALAGKASVATA